MTCLDQSMPSGPALPLHRPPMDHIDPKACKSLWAAVLAQQEVLALRPTRSMRDREVYHARQWFGSRDFFTVCDLAGLDGAAMLDRFRAEMARLDAAALRGIDRVPAQVVAMDRAEQARAFSWVNGHVTNVTGFQIFKAALAAGERWACDSRAAVEAADCRLMTFNKSTGEKKPGEVFCLALVRRHVEAGRAPFVTTALRVIRASAEAGRVAMYSADVLRPLIDVLVEFDVTDPAMVAGFIQAHPFEDLLRGVDRMRDTPEYYDKKRGALLHATLRALFRQHISKVKGTTS